MKDFKKLWDQAKVQAKASNGDVFEIYTQLSGSQIVSKYKGEIEEKLKRAGYKFHLDDKLLYLTTLSGKNKIIPIYNPEYRHIFSEAEVIIENKNGFWKEFIYENWLALSIKLSWSASETNSKSSCNLWWLLYVYSNRDYQCCLAH